jgi:cytochrome b561
MNRHPVSVRVFHWASAILIVVSAAVVLSREVTEHQPTRQILLELHRQLGLLILVGLLGRLVTRVRLGLADHASNLGRGTRVAAQVAHGMMYGVLACITLIGWALTNAHATGLRLLGIIPLPSLVRADSDLADTLSDWHVYAAWTLLAFVVLHVSAALWHHFRLRDRVLVAMLPGGSNLARIQESGTPSNGAREITM